MDKWMGRGANTAVSEVILIYLLTQVPHKMP